MSKVLPDETVQLGICLFDDNNICFVQNMCKNLFLLEIGMMTIIENLTIIIQIRLEKIKSMTRPQYY